MTTMSEDTVTPDEVEAQLNVRFVAGDEAAL